MTKILLVEDDKSLREIYGVRLLAEGYDIVSAGDGEEALAMAIKERPALIVSDVMMPKISGFDMLDILRSTTETKDIKVIMMTALSSEDQRQRGERLGADRYLVKSQVGIEDVVRTVHEVLGDLPGGATQPSQGPSQPQPAQAAAQPSAAPGQPQNTSASLPQPAAPASSPTRQGNLGDRVIQPLEKPEESSPASIEMLMEQELSGSPQLPTDNQQIARPDVASLSPSPQQHQPHLGGQPQAQQPAAAQPQPTSIPAPHSQPQPQPAQPQTQPAAPSAMPSMPHSASNTPTPGQIPNPQPPQQSTAGQAQPGPTPMPGN